MSSSSVCRSTTLSETLGDMDNILFLMGMQTTDQQDPQTEKPRGARSIHLSVAGLEMIMVDVHRSKRSTDRSARPKWTICMTFSQSHLFLFSFSSHIVVLVRVFLVTLHIVPVDERLYPLLQVSRLKGQRRDTGQCGRHAAAFLVIFKLGEANTVKS